MKECAGLNTLWGNASSVEKNKPGYEAPGSTDTLMLHKLRHINICQAEEKAGNRNVKCQTFNSSYFSAVGLCIITF